MTEIGQRTAHNGGINKQGSCRRPNRLQDGVIDVFDRLLERHKRPPERFERKFQEFIPEYGIRLPRAPALKVMSAKRVSAMCDRLYSGGRCATSQPKKTSTSDDSKNMASSSSHSKLSPDATHGTAGSANDNNDKIGSFGVNKQELNGTKVNDGEEELFNIKTSKEMRLNNEKSKDNEICFSDDMSKGEEIGFKDEKLNNKKSNDGKILNDNQDCFSEDSHDLRKESKDKSYEIPQKMQVPKVGQATHRGHEMKEKTKGQHINKQKSLEKLKNKQNYSDKNSDCSLSESNAKMSSISKNNLTSHKAGVNRAKYESSSFRISNLSRPDQDLTLIREILGQPRPERYSDVQEKSIAKVQFEADEYKEVQSDLPTVDSSKHFIAQHGSSKNILLRCEPKVSRRPLSRPKKSAKQKPTKNEYMDMLMEQLYLAAKENRVPPKSLMREVLRFSRFL